MRIGRAGRGYPWAWSVLPLLPGHIAARRPPVDLGAAADLLGRFLSALHSPAPLGHPISRVRGLPLAARDAATVARVADLGASIDGRAVLRGWRAVLEVPAWTGQPLWLHGDLHPANMLVDDGSSARSSTSGTHGGRPGHRSGRSVDAAADERARQPPRRLSDQNGTAIDDQTWQLARGWALALSLAFLAHSADNPMMAGIGRRTLISSLR